MALESEIFSNRQNNSYRCTACNKSIEEVDDAKLHPLIKTLICKTCFINYGTGDFRTIFPDGIDENGDDNYCRWCCDGGDLISCANEDSGSRCHYAFCTDCIARNVPNAPILQIKDFSTVFWNCYACDQGELKQLQENALIAINELTKENLSLRPSMKWCPKHVKQQEIDRQRAKITDQHSNSRLEPYKTLLPAPEDKPSPLRLRPPIPSAIPTVTWRLYPISSIPETRSQSKTKSPSSTDTREIVIKPHPYQLEPEDKDKEEEELEPGKDDWIFDEHIPAYQRSEKYEPLKVRIIRHPGKGHLTTKQWVSPLELLTTAKDRNKLRAYLAYLPKLSRNNLIQDYKYAMGAYGIFEST